MAGTQLCHWSYGLRFTARVRLDADPSELEHPPQWKIYTAGCSIAQHSSPPVLSPCVPDSSGCWIYGPLTRFLYSAGPMHIK